MTIVEKVEKSLEFMDVDDFGNYAIWEPFISDIILEDKEYPYIKECVDCLLNYVNSFEDRTEVIQIEIEDLLKTLGKI